MNRRSFLRRLFGGAAVAPITVAAVADVAPKVATHGLPQPGDTWLLGDDVQVDDIKELSDQLDRMIDGLEPLLPRSTMVTDFDGSGRLKRCHFADELA